MLRLTLGGGNGQVQSLPDRFAHQRPDPAGFVSQSDGEMLEWAGFALMSWSLPGLSFAIWTCANLIPRALWRHRWYHQQYGNYPRIRRAVIPGLL